MCPCTGVNVEFAMPRTALRGPVRFNREPNPDPSVSSRCRVDSEVPNLRIIQGGLSRAGRFEALIEQHYAVLYRVAFRMTRSVADAEDLVQEVCVRAFPKVDELVELEDPRGWLLLIMRRLFIDQSRRYERRHVESLEAAAEPASMSPGPAEEVDQIYRAERLDRAWRHLDADHRSLLSLHDLEGYSLAELHEMTGLKEGTLKSRLHRARVRLGRLLQAQDAVIALERGTGEAR
jgi:RNA polymerase sigma factor (sigma-70 family)